MADVEFHAAAIAEYEAALAWYLRRSVRAAIGFAVAVETAREAVARTPDAFPLCDDIHRRHRLRRYPYGLVYRVEPGCVRVVGVPHDRQLPRDWTIRI